VTQTKAFLSDLRAHGQSLPGGWSLILRAAKTEDRQENDSQESDTESESCTFTKALRQIDAQNNHNDEVHEGNQHQENPPPWPSDDLAPDVEIIDWDDAGPTGLAGFGEHFPHSDDYQQRDEQSDDRRNRAGSFALTAVAVLDLREQRGVMEEEVLRELDE
jgi:hypothetical protein